MVPVSKPAAAADNAAHGSRSNSGMIPKSGSRLRNRSCQPKRRAAQQSRTRNHKPVLRPILRDGHFAASSGWGL